MAKFSIIDASTGDVKYVGTPVYHGVYMKPSYLEFTTISSPTLINWSVGDYIVYTRTGITYKLYSIPMPTKGAASGQSGESFVYSNVQFHARTQDLSLCPFRDVVIDQGETTAYHFSAMNDVATYENVAGIAARIERNLKDFFGSDWAVEVVDGIPSTYNVGEAREFSLSGGTCLDALDKIYETWPELGWAYAVVEGVNTIRIGAPNLLPAVSGYHTNEYKYGAGLGLTLIKKTQANRDDMATRLYVYGSQRNMVARYYNGLDIYEAGSVHIPNLMLPLENWGVTDGKPDASKAYIEDASAQAIYGFIPKFVYFDGNGQKEIYPTISECTIANLRAAKTSTSTGAPNFYPAPNWSANQRIDEVSGIIDHPTDDGFEGVDGSRFVERGTESIIAAHSDTPVSASSAAQIIRASIPIVSHTFTLEGRATVVVGSQFQITASAATSAKASYSVVSGGRTVITENMDGVISEGVYIFTIPTIIVPSVSGEISIYANASVEFPPLAASTTMTLRRTAGSADFGLSRSNNKTFTIEVPQLGFDVMARAALSGNGNPTIAFKDGKCIARSFTVKGATYNASNDSWSLECYRGTDDSIGMTYPNADYPVSVGDHFVLLDLAMPDEYIGMASAKLLAEGQRLLAELSRPEPFYEPSVDAKTVAQNLAAHPEDESYVLREGKYMCITDTDIIGGAPQYIIIDTLTIYESESSIPTYRVTLREKKRESFTQSIENAIQKLQSAGGQSSTIQKASGVSQYSDLLGKPTIDRITIQGAMESYADLGLINKDFFELDTTSVPGKTLIHAKYDGLYTGGILAAGGIGPGGQSVGITGISINGGVPIYPASGSTVVNLTDIASASALSGKLDNPTGGQTGQYLRKTASGVEWATVSGGSSTWGSITGNILAQTDLANALGDKLDTSGGSLTGNLNLGGDLNMDGDLNLDYNYLNLSADGECWIGADSEVDSVMLASSNDIYLYAKNGGVVYVGSWSNNSEVATHDWVSEQGYLESSDLNGYATETWVQQQGYLTSHQSLEGYATETYVDNALGYYYTSNEVNALLANKADLNGDSNENFSVYDLYADNTVYADKVVIGGAGGVTMEIDSNGYLRINGSAYATGFVSAGGVNE